MSIEWYINGRQPPLPVDMGRDVVDAILEANWLRPEVAVWRSMDALLLQKIRLPEPVLDLGCGDGIFSFIALGGGEMKSDYDSYSNMKGSFGKTDIYDSKRRGQKPRVLRRPELWITGMDHKRNLLNAARQLGFYKKLIRHDLNRDLPLEDGSFGSIFSNTLYWIDDIRGLIDECRRVLRPDGTMVAFVPDPRLIKNSLLSKFPRRHLWVRALDNGMYESRRHAMTAVGWKKLFRDGGFDVESHVRYMSDRFVKFHNIGTRTYSKYMIRAVNSMSPRERSMLKKQVVRDILPVVKSYIEYESKLDRPRCFHMFCLRRR